ncbi:histidine--tRNA ligase [Flaviflexus salsibiostraticola]|uniref:Histidine--tRNA ligase n=1 Tax=Flaviflexus salsibiostraticola TaxID=1282737 RepID=A0A3Q8WSG6_9ACTO|nr:histidine--tRNA ligase [Flaviflexus salsibiostraticola]AZN29207.1 histidine--tRNA ligase [Flaviflexus salsibiostraticola]
MARHFSLSGFPEWLPEQRLVEQHVLTTLQRTFELHGFSGIETRAVEPVSQLLSKGETSKEIYLLSRLQAEAGGDDAELGLHFDLTVPLARYVVENAGRLLFPFKRYQIQKVWRGERPQDGRFREFVQADVDVVGQDTLSQHHDMELPLVMVDALGRLPIPRVVVRASNRKVAQGLYEAVGIADVDGALRAIDKLDKIGEKAVAEMLIAGGATEQQAEQALALARIQGSDGSIADRVLALGARSDLLDEGLHELVALIEGANALMPGAITADLKIARGLDYYTGTVYESTMIGHEDLGSVCSGGRYDSLATDGKKTYPGVGLSIGVSRVLARVLGAPLVEVSRSVPTAVLVAVLDEDHRAQSDRIAMSLRDRGIPTEVSPSAAKFGKQIRYADRRGIPYVWFPGDPDSVKDIRSGDQTDADAGEWMPPADDLHPTVRTVS